MQEKKLCPKYRNFTRGKTILTVLCTPPTGDNGAPLDSGYMLKQNEADSEDLFAGYTLDLQLHLLSTLEVFTIDQELFALFLLQSGHFHLASINFTQ